MQQKVKEERKERKGKTKENERNVPKWAPEQFLVTPETRAMENWATENWATEKWATRNAL